ncbi:hypothetical protein THAOC_22109 [Thalassiosira oceanica]|uniref:PTM/DIR17-like Tudor domain-containing protein n=1 Tax=Thalassiosira oceanica TaxID=159749 RepID=K0SH04_THAOC|nr:hypothetical protein THAOC_22109 [Thalassiosira oceanica]|mmetsp:Transcript_17545/g.40090  ORF Transcript_17545/g.40090 Transcript_17545/m.40090 type:complete len:268 (-) Transcript_17545:43-846(-)|eukprot:EJK57812.1 hypothetical protein THAOC_22109 [Thalassiosira oceanica]
MKTRRSRATPKRKSSVDGSVYTWCRVSRDFNGVMYDGSVDSYDKKRQVWHVTFDDGDEEEIDHLELLTAIDAFKGEADEEHIGRRIVRIFDGKHFGATIDRYDAKERYWHALHDDGDEEELDHAEVLQARDLHYRTVTLKEHKETSTTKSLGAKISVSAAEKKQVAFVNPEDEIPVGGSPSPKRIVEEVVYEEVVEEIAGVSSQHVEEEAFEEEAATLAPRSKRMRWLLMLGGICVFACAGAGIVAPHFVLNLKSSVAIVDDAREEL